MELNETKKEQAYSRGTEHFIRTALDILKRDGPMKFRQLFWRLVSAGEIPNDVENYELVRRTMNRLREDGRCPPGWIFDDIRPVLTIDGN